ncbi:MAG: hypothetical protein AAGI30_01825 [Planctomycetota bacterium]
MALLSIMMCGCVAPTYRLTVSEASTGHAVANAEFSVFTDSYLALPGHEASTRTDDGGIAEFQIYPGDFGWMSVTHELNGTQRVRHHFNTRDGPNRETAGVGPLRHAGDGSVVEDVQGKQERTGDSPFVMTVSRVR